MNLGKIWQSRVWMIVNAGEEPRPVIGNLPTASAPVTALEHDDRLWDIPMILEKTVMTVAVVP